MLVKTKRKLAARDPLFSSMQAQSAPNILSDVGARNGENVGGSTCHGLAYKLPTAINTGIECNEK